MVRDLLQEPCGHVPDVPLEPSDQGFATSLMCHGSQVIRDLLQEPCGHAPDVPKDPSATDMPLEPRDQGFATGAMWSRP